LPKRTNPFQELIGFLERTLTAVGVRVVESAIVKDADGIEREIDVLVNGSVSGHAVSIAIECRHQARKNDVTWIDAMMGKYQNLPIDKKVAVSLESFSPAAVAKARRHNIEALSLRDALTTDWVGQIRVVDWQMEGRRTVFHGVAFDFGKKPPTEFGGTSILLSRAGRQLGTAQPLVDWVYSSPSAVSEVVERENATHRPDFGAGINVGRITVTFPRPDLVYRDVRGESHEICALMIDVESRIEQIRPRFEEGVYKEKYIALSDAALFDAPAKLAIGVIAPRGSHEFEWF
jgi:Restriction endonuclease